MTKLLRVPRTRGTQAYVLLLLAVLAGLVLVLLGYWRRGIVLIGLVFVMSATLRAALSDEQMGLLGVRSRFFDVAWTAFLGISLVVLGLAVPGGGAA